MGGMKTLILLLIFEVVYISVNGVAFICFIKLCSFCIFLFEILVKIFSSTRVRTKINTVSMFSKSVCFKDSN